jgi:hypothetical protein
MNPLRFVVGLALCGLFACNEKPTEGSGSAPSTKVTATASATTVASAGNPDDGEGIPTEEDFEDEAEQKITSQNADSFDSWNEKSPNDSPIEFPTHGLSYWAG